MEVNAHCASIVKQDYGDITHRICWIVPCWQEVYFLIIRFFVYPLVTVICGHFSNQPGPWHLINLFALKISQELKECNPSGKININWHRYIPLSIVIDLMWHLEEELRLQSLVGLEFTVPINRWGRTITSVNFRCCWGSKIAETIFPDQYPACICNIRKCY